MPSAEHGGRAQTLRVLLRNSARRLNAARVSYGHGTTNAHDEAAWLALHALNLPFEDLDRNLDRTLSANEVRRVAALIGERIRTRMPAAYLVQEAWLGNHRFYVDERVIVPRSFIAELLNDQLAPWIRENSQVRSALDLCTGSGCLAILLALTFPRTKVHGADISKGALAVARRNVLDYGLRGRVTLFTSDLFAKLHKQRYDLIVSNPPYVREAVMRTLPSEYRKEPALALAGGRDGLDLVRRIIAEAVRHLNPGGLLVVEVGHNRKRVEKTFPELPLIWAQTSGGDDCVFLITRESLQAAAAAAAHSARASRATASLRSPATGSPARASAAAGAQRRRTARASGGSR
ncbi:MAG: 50S ribosomal protein L3 N(5)-glutamine methyltransferase [Burkholderiales bacterium]